MVQMSLAHKQYHLIELFLYFQNSPSSTGNSEAEDNVLLRKCERKSSQENSVGNVTYTQWVQHPDPKVSTAVILLNCSAQLLNTFCFCIHFLHLALPSLSLYFTTLKSENWPTIRALGKAKTHCLLIHTWISFCSNFDVLNRILCLYIWRVLQRMDKKENYKNVELVDCCSLDVHAHGNKIPHGQRMGIHCIPQTVFCPIGCVQAKDEGLLVCNYIFSIGVCIVV